MEEKIIKRNNFVLPDDVLYFFANNYLSEKDSLALALSGSISKRFAALHGRNKYATFPLNNNAFLVETHPYISII